MTEQTALPLFYKKIVPLNKEQHREMYVEPISDFKHTEGTNSIYIAAVEFLLASKEYPIVFGQSADNNFFPVVILGLKGNRNLFINNEGAWQANYLPAYVRRYPFILASVNNDGNFTVCIDESYPGFNSKKKGQPLFTENGEESELLKQSVGFLKEYQNHIQLTQLFCNNIQKLDLLEPMQANVELTDGDKYSLGGFWGINRAKLKALPGDKLMELVKSDQMELVYAHLNSLENLKTLIRKLD